MKCIALCHEHKAGKPYYLDTVGKNMYTIEELCYYLWQYAHLLDKELFCKALHEWLREELQMRELADTLERMRIQSASLEERVLAVFDSIVYLGQMEREYYAKVLRNVENMTLFERKKRKADDLVRSKKYDCAICEYKKLLKEEEAKDDAVAATLYHNMGVAYSKMFLFKQGSEYFLKSFLLVPGKEKMKEYKACLRLSEEVIAEDELVAEFPSAETIDMQLYEQMEQIQKQEGKKEQEIRTLNRFKQEHKIAEYYQEMEEVLHRWNEECREYMR